MIWGIGKVYFILFVSLFVCLLRKAQSLRKYFLMLRCFLCVSKASGMKRWSQVDVSWDLFLITHSSIVFAKIFYYILSRIILAISEDFRNSNISSAMLLGCLKSFANNFLYWCAQFTFFISYFHSISPCCTSLYISVILHSFWLIQATYHCKLVAHCPLFVV